MTNEKVSVTERNNFGKGEVMREQPSRRSRWKEESTGSQSFEKLRMTT